MPTHHASLLSRGGSQLVVLRVATPPLQRPVPMAASVQVWNGRDAPAERESVGALLALLAPSIRLAGQ